MNGEYISIETLRVIQSLEQENKRLAEELEIEKDISDGMLETIDKAIKYIEQKEILITYQELGLHSTNVKQELLKILRGDKE